MIRSSPKRRRRLRFETLEDRTVLSTIQGFKWNDINGNGVRDTDLISGNQPVVVFVVDVSGSTTGPFAGGSVGDVNRDGLSNTILDGEIAGFLALNQRLVELGLGTTANVAITVFGSTSDSVDVNPQAAGKQLTANPLADADGNGVRDIDQVLRQIRPGHQGVGTSTNFEAGLQTTIDTLDTLSTPVGEGNVVFLSDGEHNGGNFNDEVTLLRNQSVNLRAFGVGNGASLTQLRLIDSNAAIFVSTDELLSIFSGGASNEVQYTEPGLPDWTIFLDTNNNGVLDEGEASTTTDSEGQYSFTGLAAGQYVVAEQSQSSWNQTFPGPSAGGVHSVTLGDNETRDTIHFGNERAAGVSGYVYHDRNQNSEFDVSDRELSGWTVFVDTNLNGQRELNEPFTVTDRFGAYLIEPLPRGNHVVRAAIQDGWSAWHPQQAARGVLLLTGGIEEHLNFGFVAPPPPRIASISPTPNEFVSTGVDSIEIMFDRAIDPVTLWVPSFSLLASGGDGQFNEGNEIAVPIGDISWDASTNTATLQLDGFLPRDTYQLVISDQLIDAFGNALDGELSGLLPSGDGNAGGSFLSYFVVTNAPPRVEPQQLATLQTAPVSFHLQGEDADGDTFEFRIASGPSQGTLTPGATSADWIYTPNGTFSGIEVVSFVASDGISEGDVAEVTIAVVSAPTDLQPTSLTVVSPSVGLSLGDSVTLAWTGRNNGPGSTIDRPRDWTDEIYLSLDDELSDDDILIGSQDLDQPSIAPNGEYAAQLTAKLPLTPEWTGEAYFIVKVDAGSTQLDVDLSNNLLATQIDLQPAVQLIAPYFGKFVDSHTPITISWQDVAPEFSGEIKLLIDADNNPWNGSGQSELATGLSEDPDGDSDSLDVVLPALTPGVYYLFAALLRPDDAGVWYSDPLPVRMVDEAYADPESLQDAVGGAAYEVREVELGRVGDEMLFRVRTNFNPRSRGGDLYLNVGGSFRHDTGTVVGIAVNNRRTSSGAPVLGGAIYLGATFDRGLVVREHPTFIRDYEAELAGQSQLQVSQPTGRDWKYEINGSFSISAVDSNADSTLEMAWAMYCGNDLGVTRTGDPEMEPDLVGDQLRITSDFLDAPPTWGDTIDVDYVIANLGSGDAGASSVSFYLSADAEITPSDLPLREFVDVPPLVAGERDAAQIRITLPDAPPPGFESVCGMTLGMIVDVRNQVAEMREGNNRNRGEGLDLSPVGIGGRSANEGIDRWYATRSPFATRETMTVTWTVCVPVSGDHTLRVAIEDGIWTLGPGTTTANPFVRIDNLRLTGDERSVAISTTGIVNLGYLENGMHRLTIDSFGVPQTTVVEEVDFVLHRQSSSFLTADKELQALFVSDHPRLSLYDDLASRYAPILNFTSGERFDQPFDAEAIWQGGWDPERSPRGDSNDYLDLSHFAPTTLNPPGPSVSGPATIYASILEGAGALTDELAITYYFHYPRSDWGEHGGLLANTHEGDWEGATLFLRRVASNWVPDRLALAQHIKGFPGVVTVPWTRLNRDGDHPQLFVGLGGHATYPGPGATVLFTGTEKHYGDSVAVSAPVQVLPRAGDSAAPEWLLYSGLWGQPDLGALYGDVAPRGPLYLESGFDKGERWLNPWSWSEGAATVNTVQTLRILPDRISQPDELTLEAFGVEPVTALREVNFFRESNGTAGLQRGPDGDEHVGRDEFALNGWSLTFNTAALSNGTHTFYAQASEDDVRRIGPYVTATVQAVGRPPTANPDNFTVNEDGDLELPWDQLFANDVDPDSPASEWAVTELLGASGGTVENDSVNRLIRFTPAQNFNGQAQFGYTLFDGLASTSNGIVVIDVAALNDPPTGMNVTLQPIAENSSGFLGTIEVTDPDDHEEHVFFVSDDRFEIVDGELRVRSGMSLDFETSPDVEISIMATDQGGESIERSVTVRVLDVNEPPTEIQLLANTVQENQPGAILGTLSATDPEAGQTAQFSVDDERFQVDAGVLLRLRNGVSLDFEQTPTITLMVTATDSGTPPASATLPVTIVVRNINESPTGISLDGGEIAENAAGAIAGRLSLIDPDANDPASFEIVEGGERFEIQGDQLKLKSGISLDFESEQQTSVRVLGRDSAVPPRTISVLFTIHVTDQNEPPTFVGLTNTSVNENQPGEVVGDFLGTDLDAFSVLTYFISEETPFAVSGSQLIVRPDVILDFETEQLFTVTITVTDAGGLSFSRELVITVLDVNEAPHNLVLNPSSVLEMQRGADVGQLQGEDADSLDQLQFEVVSGPVEIEGDRLRLRRDFAARREEGQFVTAVVKVVDLGGLSFEKQFEIAVLENLLPWQNLRDRFDTNNDGVVSPQDVLVVINRLNTQGPGPLTRPDPIPSIYMDVTGDNNLSPIDALQIINRLNSGSSEGELLGAAAWWMDECRRADEVLGEDLDWLVGCDT